MNEIKTIIEDIRNKLANNVYQKEEHVRLAIIARICQALGWDIWNPEEFFPEFPIKLKNKDGIVDLVLFHSSIKDNTPDVFFEIKAVGKLEGNIRDSEEQLQDYNYYNSASITILTDGRQWRFYLSSAPGTFNQKMFCSLDLLEDKEDNVIGILKDILSKDRYVKDAVNTAQLMLNDLKLSKEISRARDEANQRSDNYPDMNKYQLVQLVLKERGHDISIEEIRRLWNYKDTQSPKIQLPLYPVDDNGSYKFSVPKRVFVIDKWFEVSNWGELKAEVYSYIIDRNLKINLKGRKGASKDRTGFIRSKRISGNLYIDIGFNADSLVRHCRELLQSLGYDPKKALKIETSSEIIKGPHQKSSHIETEHLEHGSQEIIMLYKELKHRLVDDLNLSINYMKQYIAFKARRNVIDVEIQKNKLKLYLNIPIGKLNDPKGLCQDVSNKGHWGNGDYRIVVDNAIDLDYILTLVKQVINYQEVR